MVPGFIHIIIIWRTVEAEWMGTGIERSSETHAPHNQTPSLTWMYFHLLKQLSSIPCEIIFSNAGQILCDIRGADWNVQYYQWFYF